jgi:hypothetical protein
MSDGMIPSEEALAILMSVRDLDERRQMVSDDVDEARRFALIDSLTLALVLEVPFGKSRRWRALCRRKPIASLTNSMILEQIMHGNRSDDIMWRLESVMPRFRLRVLKESLAKFHENPDETLKFDFIQKELDEAGAVIALELGQAIGGEIFWSYDTFDTQSGMPSPFVFSMINRKQLLGCVHGPYDLDSPMPEDFDLQDIYHWEEDA